MSDDERQGSPDIRTSVARDTPGPPDFENRFTTGEQPIRKVSTVTGATGGVTSLRWMTNVEVTAKLLHRSPCRFLRKGRKTRNLKGNAKYSDSNRIAHANDRFVEWKYRFVLASKPTGLIASAAGIFIDSGNRIFGCS